MAKHSLVIVESPSKAKTIGKYLGKEFEVKACMGHLRDLPKSTLGVDLEHDFEPVYKPIKGKEDIIADLKKSAKSAEMVYLATDPDREGEAISWHLKQLLNLPEQEYTALLADLAVKAAVTGREAVILSQKDRTRYGKQVVTAANERLNGGRLTLSEQTRPIQGGVILSDGDVEVNCSFETLVRLQRGALDRPVAQILFGD